ncbi:glycosyltransferase [Rubrobacter taiwanensis]|jgi:GT2 family glycosyltransferase|uniref:Glycosyltransferase n=2 Tax=Rubrobacter taiwanensis TaxID=185139 RepID=A0A4R1BSW7_9ACTN|nr:glycosyltransferase [Rubrobacter taiwanensis]
MRGVTYGTFAPGELGLFPAPERVERDFATMAAAGVNAVRVYTVPDTRLLNLAEQQGLKLLVGVWWEDPLYTARPTRELLRETAAAARETVRRTVRELAGHPAVLGFILGNEIPGSIVRWHGRKRVEEALRGLYETGKEAAPEALFSYANYPTTGYLDTSCFDFECYNIFLEEEGAFRRYLTQLQVSAGGRPLVLTELGLDSRLHGEERQAEVLDWQLRAAREAGLAGTCVFSWTDDWWVKERRVEGWSFGITREDREPKPAFEVVANHYRSGLPDLREEWPRASVVVCAYNAEATLGECLESLKRLEYPDYEVLVVDDGSEDGTAGIAREYPVRLIQGGRLGLSGARNLGLQNATGEIVAYIDADARADPDWLTYLVLALEAPDAAGAGGPNLPPPEDPPVAQCIARAPGGPVHVLIDNERAEHVPGCNMAYRRDRLSEIGGFDPIYRAAGDDVDVCWKLLDLGYTIRFHPAALVWHHSRGRVRDFWRQQVGYGRAEALVARNHPDKFNGLGRAIWRGVIYGPASIVPGRTFVYTGRFGEAPFQRLYQERSGIGGSHFLYVLLALVLLAALDPHLWPLPVFAAGALLAGCLVHGWRVAGREGIEPAWKWGSLIGWLYLLQPVAREVGRLRSWKLAYPPVSALAGRFPPLRPAGGGMFVAEGVGEAERTAFLEEVCNRLRAQRLKARSAPAWGMEDLLCDSFLFWRVLIVSCLYGEAAYLRSKWRPRTKPLLAAALVVLLVGAWPPNPVAGVAALRDGTFIWSPVAAAAVAAVVAAAFLVEGWVFRRRVRRALSLGADEKPGGP